MQVFKKFKSESKNESENTAAKAKANGTGITCPSCQKGEIVERFSKRGNLWL